MGSGGGNTETLMKWVATALIVLFAVPLMFTLFVPQHEINVDPYEQQIAQLQESYYLSTGHTVTATTEVWGLTGIYTPYNGSTYSTYGITDDGWIYGKREIDYVPTQYDPSNANVIGGYRVGYNESDHLYYYLTAPSNRSDIVTASGSPPNLTLDAEGKSTVYTEVAMDNANISSIFFTPGGKTTTDKGYYYEYTGYRYAFQPLRPYTALVGGSEKEVVPNSTSLSLIWYRYSTLSGIAGQLTLSGSDTGLSYLNADDIVREFNSSTSSSTFDMTFNNVAMHISIRLDPTYVSKGYSPKDCFNNGWWSVIVSSDAVATSKLNDATYDFNPNNVFDTLIKLFTFRITEDYNIEGWMGILASLIITMPLYACLIVIALEYHIVLIFVAILGAIQAITSIFSGWNPFG